MSKFYAGTIVEKREGTFGDDATAVLNLIVASTKKAFGGIEIAVKKTVVLFRKEAEIAGAKLKEGDRVYFDDVVRNPRIYTTKRGSIVETVDMIAENFTKLTKAELEAGLAEGSANMMSGSDFDFTDDDRASLQALDIPSADVLDDDGEDVEKTYA